jgi:hypothetical protein
MTEKEPTATEANKLQKLADAYKKDAKQTRADNPGYSFRLKVVGGQTVPVVKKIGK